MDSDIAMPGSLSQAPRAERGDDDMVGMSLSSLAAHIRLQHDRKKKTPPRVTDPSGPANSFVKPDIVSGPPRKEFP
jgi:hypothetical protein